MALRDLPDSKLIWFIDKVSKTVLALLVFTIFTYYSGFWLSEWLVSFLPQLLIIIFGHFLVIISLYLRFILRDGFSFIKEVLSRADLAILIFTAGLFLWVFALSFYPYEIDVNAGENRIEVATFNALLGSNSLQSDSMLFFEQSDVAFLQEVKSAEVEKLSEILGLTNYYISDCKCSADDSEVAIISRYPLANTSKIFESPLGVIIKADLSEQNITLLAVHLSAPVSAEYVERRNQTLDLLAVITDDLEAAGVSYIVAGDFNTSVYTREFKSAFSNSKVAVDRFWPSCTWYGYSSLMCTAIDHIVVSKNFNVNDVEYGSLGESDHRPVSASLSY